MDAYLDVILIYSKALSEHLSHIQRALKWRLEMESYGKMKNMVFGVEEVEYLSCTLRKNKLYVYPTKVKAVKAR